MCGITGIYNFDHSSVNKNFLINMNEMLYDRGPDDSGHYIDNYFGMAMRRLSIIGIDNGHQPILDRENKTTLIFNGEIYNYIELKKKMIEKGHIFYTNTDSEVIIKLYKEYKYEAVNYLNGMFAFAIWDEKDKSLWIVRDRLGIKPLYYYLNENIFLFSSNLESFKEHPDFNKKISEKNILNYLSLAYTNSDESIYEKVNKLLPGSQIIISQNDLSIKKYWDLDDIQKKDISEIEFIDQSSYLIKDSIKIQGRSDVEVGTFLSGGLDSSIITSLYKINSSHDVHSFSMSFKNKQMNDNFYAKKLSKQINTLHHEFTIDYKKGLIYLHELLENIDEPIGDSAIIPTFFISKEAKKKNIKVLLSGAGGDEIFGGYRRYFRYNRDLLAGKLKLFPNIIFKILSSSGLIKLSNYGLLLSNKGASYATSTSGIDLGIIINLLSTDAFNEIIDSYNDKFGHLSYLQKNKFSYERMKCDISSYLSNDILALTDKTSMANSVEVRVPFLDHRILELVFSNKNVFSKMNDFNNSKFFLKNFAKDLLPDFILNREKEGFNCPITNWIIEDYFSDKIIYSRLMNLSNDNLNKIINRNFLELIYKDLKILTKSAEILFLIYAFDYWYEKKF